MTLSLAVPNTPVRYVINDRARSPDAVARVKKSDGKIMLDILLSDDVDASDSGLCLHFEQDVSANWRRDFVENRFYFGGPGGNDLI